MPVSNVLRPVLNSPLGPALNEPFFSGAIATDADVLLWMAAVVTNGGTVSAARLAIVNTFVAAEKASGAWALTDDYWGLWAENAIQALTSLKQRRLATAVNSPTFTQDRSYAFNGTTQYLNTGFVPSVNGLAMSVNSVHIESYERTNVSAAASPVGSSAGGNNQINTYSRQAGNVLASVMGVTATFTLAVTTSIRLTQTGRNGATVNDNYGAKDGVDLVRTITYAALGTALPAFSLYVGGVNVSGVFAQGKATSIGYLSCGASLNGVQRLARFNNVQAWATAVGAQV